MKLSTKLSILVLVLMCGIVFTGVFSLFQMSRVNDKSVEITTNWMPATVAIQTMETAITSYRRYEVSFVYVTDPQWRKEYAERMDKTLLDMEPAVKAYEALIAGPEEQNLYNQYLTDWRAYLDMSRTLRSLISQGKDKEATELQRGQSLQFFDKATRSLRRDVEYNVQNGKATSAEGDRLYRQSLWSVSVAMLCFALLGVGLGWYIVRDTLRLLGKDPGQLMGIARRVAEGDYAVDDGSPRVGVFGNIVSMVGAIRENIAKAREESERAQQESNRAREAMQQAEGASAEAQQKAHTMLAAADRLQEVSGTVSSASAQLTVQVEQSERGAAEQAQRVAETATAMEQMNSTVLEVARNAMQASTMSTATRQKAEDGAQVVKKAVDSIEAVRQQSALLREDMGRLDNNAKAITQIMGVISDIADQTNLLALNAAIEAARAGEAGRGFAVVADEVRKLAEKTMASTTDVGNAIRDIQQSVAQSMAQVDSSAQSIEQATGFATQSGAALGEIVRMADDTADQVRAIATASEEQSASSEQINQSINQVNAIAGKTAQAMREAAQAVTDLTRQAQVLTRLVDEMKRG